MSGRDGLAEVLTPLVARIAACDYCPDRTTACLSCSDDARHLADVVRAYLTSDETVERAARAIGRWWDEALAAGEPVTGFDPLARAALATATEGEG